MKKHLFYSLLLALGMTVFIACEKDDPEIPNEEELITTLTYTLTPSSGGIPVVLRFQDLDGDGGLAPTITADALSANTTYSGSVELLNEQEVPTEDITEEVANEREEHQFFYQTTVAGIEINYNDMDSDGNPLGLATSLQTGETGSGTLTIILRHEPNKSNASVAMGDITNAGGETDIEVTFNINVQ